MLRHLGIVGLAALTLGCSGHGPQDLVAAATAPCHLKGLEQGARCGKIGVPEDPSSNAGKKIDIAYAVLPAKARYKEPDPLFVLAGGPGQSAQSIAGPMSKVFSVVNRKRDIVFIDQRGTGKSNNLTCKMPDSRAPLAERVTLEPQLAALRACKDKLPGDARFYITSIAVQDFDAVRQKLGYGRINLWGGSYGTRAALEYTRQFAPNVRTLTIDGVAPSDMVLPLSMAKDSHDNLMNLIDACEKDKACNANYPGLRSKTAALFSEQAVRLELTNSYDGKRQMHTVDGVIIAQAMRSPLYAPQLASVLPHAVLRATQGNGDALVALGAGISNELEEQFSIGMHLSVVCAEDMPRAGSAAIAAAKNTLFGTKYLEQYKAMCDGWPAGEVPQEFYAPVKSDVPALILSGALDPVTPPRHGDAIGKTLSRSQHVVVPAGGHGITALPCAGDLIAKFIKSEGAEKLDSACLTKLPRPLFYAHPVAPATGAGK